MKIKRIATGGLTLDVYCQVVFIEVMGNSSDSTLYKAARQGDVETVRAALKNGANPNQSADGNMPVSLFSVAH